MFNESKYSVWYYHIISRAKSQCRSKKEGYYESHHVVPRSLGGTNVKDNIVLLTAKEHFICHLLLVKMVDGGRDQRKMYHALHLMMTDRYGHRRKDSRSYENLRKMFSKLMSGDNHHNRGKKVSDSTRSKNSKASKGRKWFTNGEIDTFSRECPEGFVRGRSKILGNNLGDTNPAKRPEIKEKISAYARSRTGSKNPSSRPCIIQNVYYASQREACEAIGVSLYILGKRIASKDYSDWSWSEK